jgi:hypothetical protein
VAVSDGKTPLLVTNPINRSLIHSPMLPQLKKNSDKLIEFHIQIGSPRPMPSWHSGIP